MTIRLEPLAVDGPVGPLAGWAMSTGQEGATDATPVLFLHPINTAGKAWAGVAAALGPARRCLLPDLRGHGGSVQRGPFTLDGYVGDALAVLDATGVERAHVVGGSLGGTIAVALAAAVPDRVVSVAAFGSMLSLPVTQDALETVAQTIRALGTRGFFEEIGPATVAPQRRDDKNLIQRIVTLALGSGGRTPEMVTAILLNALQSDATDRAVKVRCPVLVVTGEHDGACPPEVGRAMADALGTTHVLEPGVGHLPMLEVPALVAGLLTDHFARTEGA